LIALAGASLIPASYAQADSLTSLPIKGFYQIVADTAHGHLFISQGSSSLNEIIVTDLTGQEVATIPGQDGVMGIALSPDGSTLYAALSADHAVTAISAATLQQTASYPIGNANTPQDVAVQSGKLWVSYSTGSVGNGGIGDINLSANPPAFETQAAMGGWYDVPELAADPGDSGALVAAQPGIEPAPVASYDVAVDPATVRAHTPGLQNCTFANDLAVVPGGSEFLPACNVPSAQFRYSTTDLSQQGSYASSGIPDAVAIDSDGDVAAGSIYRGSTASPNLYIYQQGGDSPLNTYNLTYNVAARGLAWSADNSQLFAVLQNSPTAFYLQVIDNPAVAPASLSLSGPSNALIGNSVTLTGTLTVGAEAPPAGTAIAISRTEAGSTAVQTFTASTSVTGSFTLTDTPSAPGQYTYTASYAGTRTSASATASQAVDVTLISSSLTENGPSAALLGKPVTLTGDLALETGTPPSETPITITRTAAGSASVKTFTVSTDSTGNFTLTDTPPAIGQYTYAAAYGGTSTISPATATQSVKVTLNPAVLTISGPPNVAYESTIHVTAHLGPTATNRTVAIYARPIGSKTSVLLRKGRVDSKGDLTASYKAGHSTRFSVVFAGDAADAAGTATRTVTVLAAVSDSLSGYYRSQRIGRITYRVFHHTAQLHALATVSPNKHGECVKFEVQEYYRGHWHANAATGCAILNRASKGGAIFRLTHADIGYHYRIRADFVRTGTDTSNGDNNSAWAYLIIVR
jgi:hypothetical protein